MKYYVILTERESKYSYYNWFETNKLAEEYKNLLILYFTTIRFRIIIRNNLNNIKKKIILLLDECFNEDVSNVIHHNYNQNFNFEKFEKYFYNGIPRE